MMTVALVASAAAAAGLAVMFTAAPASAATKGTDTVTADPAPGSKLAPNGPYFRLVARPGSSITQTVHLVNHNDHAIDVRIAGLDGYTSNATGAAYTTPSRVATRMGTWIVVSTPELTLQAGQPRDVSFTVHVPRNATAGQHLGAVGMWVPLSSSTTTVPGGKQAGFAVSLQGERVIAVEVVVPGPSQPRLQVNGVQAVAGPSGLRLQILMANTGNAFTRGSGVVTVADTKLNYPFTIDTFVSHTAIDYLVPWTRTVVPGSHEVSIKLTYDGKRVTTWNGQIAITGAFQRQLQKSLRETQIGAPAAPRSWSWLFEVAGLVAVLVCAAGAFWLRRRFRRVPVLAA